MLATQRDHRAEITSLKVGMQLSLGCGDGKTLFDVDGRFKLLRESVDKLGRELSHKAERGELESWRSSVTEIINNLNVEQRLKPIYERLMLMERRADALNASVADVSATLSTHIDLPDPHAKPKRPTKKKARRKR